MCGDATAGVCLGVSGGLMGDRWRRGGGCGAVLVSPLRVMFGVLWGQCLGGGTWGVVDWGGKFFANAKTSTRRHYLPPAFNFQSIRILCEKDCVYGCARDKNSQ